MRFWDMIKAKAGVNRPRLKPKPYEDETVTVGHKVRCEWHGHRPVIGIVIGELGECWVIEVQKSDKYGHHWTKEELFHKVHCHRVRASQVSKVGRHKSVTEPQGPEPYGDGELD